MMRVLLTGASGFLGSAMLRRLSLISADIHAVNRSGVGAPSARWHSADLRNPREAERVIRQVEPTHVLHNAWDVTPGTFWHDPANLDWATGSIQLVAAAGAIGARFVGVGTCAEYDWSYSLLNEDTTPISPLTLYGRTKAMVWDAASRLPSSAWGRVFVPYGPGDNARRLFPSIFHALRQGAAVDLTSGRQERDFVFVDDVAEFFVSLLPSSSNGAFNVGSGEAVSIRAASTVLAQTMGADPALLLFCAKPERDEPPLLVADMAKARKLLSFKCKTTLAQGFSAILQSEPVH